MENKNEIAHKINDIIDGLPFMVIIATDFTFDGVKTRIIGNIKDLDTNKMLLDVAKYRLETEFEQRENLDKKE